MVLYLTIGEKGNTREMIDTMGMHCWDWEVKELEGKLG